MSWTGIAHGPIHCPEALGIAEDQRLEGLGGSCGLVVSLVMPTRLPGTLSASCCCVCGLVHGPVRLPGLALSVRVVHMIRVPKKGTSTSTWQLWPGLFVLQTSSVYSGDLSRRYLYRLDLKKLDRSSDDALLCHCAYSTTIHQGLIYPAYTECSFCQTCLLLVTC